MGCEYIEQHFKRGFTTNEIFDLLAVSHGIILSKRTFERILNLRKLWRRKNKTDVADVATFIQRQLETSAQCHSYRWIHQKCWLNGIVTDSETVWILLPLLDGEGVDLRSRDCKRMFTTAMVPTMSGTLMAITSLSQRSSLAASWMLWSTLEGALLDSNRGTEIGHMAEIQRFLHFSDNQAETDNVTFVPSTGNQRIERLWQILWNECAPFWMDLLERRWPLLGTSRKSPWSSFAFFKQCRQLKMWSFVFCADND